MDYWTTLTSPRSIKQQIHNPWGIFENLRKKNSTRKIVKALVETYKNQKEMMGEKESGYNSFNEL